jgi:hypothetical protein
MREKTPFYVPLFAKQTTSILTKAAHAALTVFFEEKRPESQ